MVDFFLMHFCLSKGLRDGYGEEPIISALENKKYNNVILLCDSICCPTLCDLKDCSMPGFPVIKKLHALKTNDTTQHSEKYI